MAPGGPTVVTALSADQLEYLGHHPPGEAVALALAELLANDHDLLEIDANERSITFRFAMFLQPQLPEWTVDCEIQPGRCGTQEARASGALSR